MSRFMKFTSVLPLFLWALPVKAVKLDNDKKKMSYAVGQEIGHSLKMQNIDVDADVLASSIKDAIANKKSQLSPEEVSQVMQKFQTTQMEKQKAMGDKNKAAGDAFLAAKEKEKDVKKTKSGLLYTVVEEGKGDKPKETDSVVADYRGTFIDGTEFDSSKKHGGPATFPVKGVIPGWTEALLDMKTGEKRKLYIPANLAYGPRGTPGIPPNSTLVFDIELKAINKGGK